MPDPDSKNIHANQLSCRRGGRWLFRDLDFTADTGTLVRISGPNGAGKTTLLRLVAGLGLPESGEVRWNGVSIQRQRMTFNASLAWLGHSDGIKAELTPRENLRFHQALVAQPDAAVVETALVDTGLSGVAGRVCRYLSMGQRRRVALARLMLTECPLWLLDEPLTALDVQGQEFVQELVGRHCRNGGIAILVSHQAFEASGLCYREVALG